MTPALDSADRRLADLGIELPAAASPVARFVPCVLSGRQLYVSGQIPLVERRRSPSRQSRRRDRHR